VSFEKSPSNTTVEDGKGSIENGRLYGDRESVGQAVTGNKKMEATAAPLVRSKKKGRMEEALR